MHTYPSIAIETAATKYTWPGSSWRPSACEADVIATRPQVLLIHIRRQAQCHNGMKKGEKVRAARFASGFGKRFWTSCGLRAIALSLAASGLPGCHVGSGCSLAPGRFFAGARITLGAKKRAGSAGWLQSSPGSSMRHGKILATIQSRTCARRPCEIEAKVSSVVLKTMTCMAEDTLAERLRRRPAKPMGSPRVGSNPTGVVSCATRPCLLQHWPASFFLGGSAIFQCKVGATGHPVWHHLDLHGPHLVIGCFLVYIHICKAVSVSIDSWALHGASTCRWQQQAAFCRLIFYHRFRPGRPCL